MFGTTNDIYIKKDFVINEFLETINGTIEIRPNNKCQVNFGDLYIDDKFVVCLYDDMGEKLLEILKELED